MPIEAVSAFSTSGPEWQIGMDAASDPALANDGGTVVDGAGAGSGFGGVLTKQLQGLADLQTDATRSHLAAYIAANRDGVGVRCRGGARMRSC